MNSRCEVRGIEGERGRKMRGGGLRLVWFLNLNCLILVRDVKI